jgi:molybdenum cofactor cytidylyltransferase
MSLPVAGLLLAAGRGSRFDESGRHNKLLATLGGVTVAARSAARLGEVVEHRLAVIRPDSDALRQQLEAMGCVVSECADAELGMGHSLAHAVSEAIRRFDPGAALIMLADMPFIEAATLQALIEAATASEVIAAPRFNGQRGQPVLFGRAHFAALQRSSGDRGAIHLLREHPVTYVDVDDPGVLQDIDRPEDLPAL